MLTESSEPRILELVPEWPACDGRLHQRGEQGHDSERAAYAVAMLCSGCGWTAIALLCAGRVEAVCTSTCTMNCPRCRATVPWQDLWIKVEGL